ncbi:MAG TPA: NapC/NirT family cytochrome c [Vicinamibacterales bacterium]|nr:NapC/NirT family cytochrome c [Vicinamibacterales bacterium]
MKRHPVSVLGVAIVTLSALVFVFVFLLDWFGLHTNPYLGIVFFLILPAFFVLGLVMIPLGMYLDRRRHAKGLEPRRFPQIDLNNPRHRRTVLAVVSLTLVNLLIVSLAAYRGIDFMDSPQFCGQVCHTVMEPEFTAYQEGPHSRIRCVDCHIGPGAPWFVKSKLDGSRQVLSVMRHTYSKPIATPVRTLRPARDTCEQCHWPEKFHGDKVEIIRDYANDEKSTESVTRLMVHVGGGSERMGVATGIHWHMNVANVIEYVATDAKRQVIPYVRLKDRQGNVREFRATGVTDDQIAKGERRRMDCMDCHNRPSHPLSPSPERAVDGALARGEISRELPFARREAVQTLKASYPDRATAEQQIAQRLRAFYGQNYASLVPAHGAEIDQLVRAAQRLYGRNVFPAMNVTWGTHENNLGHTDAPGCFRCHDDQHKTADGRVIKQDCDLCHDIQ